jgi:hypothetical protein
MRVLEGVSTIVQLGALVARLSKIVRLSAMGLGLRLAPLEKRASVSMALPD